MQRSIFVSFRVFFPLITFPYSSCSLYYIKSIIIAAVVFYTLQYSLFLFLLLARDCDIYLNEKIDFLKVLALVQMTGGENVLSPFNEEVFL